MRIGGAPRILPLTWHGAGGRALKKTETERDMDEHGMDEHGMDERGMHATGAA